MAERVTALGGDLNAAPGPEHTWVGHRAAATDHEARAGVTISVLLADDQEMMRTGFRLILSAESDITVVSEAATGVDAVALARELRPDVVLMDIRMPELDGLEATRQLAGFRAADPLRVVVVTTFDLDEYVYGALRGSTCGFLLKDAGPRLLVEAVRAAAAGDALTSPAVKTHVASVAHKLSACNPVEIAAWAWKADLMEGRPQGLGQR